MKPLSNMMSPAAQNNEDEKQFQPPCRSEEVIAPSTSRSDFDWKRINRFKANRKMPQPPVFNREKQEGAVNPAGDLLLHLAAISEAFGTANPHLSHILTYQLFDAAPGGKETKIQNLNAALVVLFGLKPRDELESLLVTQMVAVHCQAMEYMRRGIISEQTTEGVTLNTERATKMLRTFTTQMEALNRYRGKSSQQKVVVEHVTVNSGGQAIVGSVAKSKINSSEEEGGGGRT